MKGEAFFVMSLVIPSVLSCVFVWSETYLRANFRNHILPRKLGSIRAKLGLLTKRSLMAKIFRQENMVETLAKFKTELRNQIDIFNVRISFVWWTQRRGLRLLIWMLYFS